MPHMSYRIIGSRVLIRFEYVEPEKFYTYIDFLKRKFVRPVWNWKEKAWEFPLDDLEEVLGFCQQHLGLPFRQYPN